MKLLKKLFVDKKKMRGSKSKDNYQDALNILGAEQFRKLIDKGLQIPIAIL